MGRTYLLFSLEYEKSYIQGKKDYYKRGRTKQMIDLHCHILSGIDDGAQTVTDSLAMAQKAVQEGIHTIVATPHHQNGNRQMQQPELAYLQPETAGNIITFQA